MSKEPPIPQPPPEEAWEKFDEARRRRAGLGIGGHVSLRCDEAPGKVPEWSVWIGNMLFAKLKPLTNRKQ